MMAGIFLKKVAQGAERFIGAEDLQDKLKSRTRLKIKFGVDPTRPDLTFGHLVVFKKLRQLQDLGHEAILLIGDYTALIGDPSGRSSTRPMLSPEEVHSNAKTYLDQAFKILDPSKTTIRYNSEWLSPLRLEDIIHLSSRVTLARIIERDDFAKRYADKEPISMVELLYPLLQGYDSVALEADLELGGNDQLFNLLMGRILQKEYGQKEQAVLCMPLLVGLDGVRKMSKSYDNYIALNEDATSMFGKIMSISDETMWSYYKLLLMKEEADLVALKQEHPMHMKKQLALELTGQFHPAEAAQHALEQFEKVFSNKELPDTMPTFSWQSLTDKDSASVLDLLAATQVLDSKKELKRLIEQGGLKFNQNKATNPLLVLEKPLEKAYIFQLGKKQFIKIT
jgi:tyrosyl-tRNA synthetase